MIHIVKASAGSGKTFSLARTYIRLLFSKRDPYAYRHILAVTFTNKATDEMKGRILRELSVLAWEPGSSPYYGDLVPEMFPGPGELGRAAGNMLSSILHDYSAFSVSTIDRFFQQTLKAFSREIGQFASYQVELDKDSLVAESVDRILDSLTEDDTDLLGWLTEGALEQIEKGGRYSLEYNLSMMAGRLKSDSFREAVDRAGLDVSQAYSKASLSGMRTRCMEVISSFREMVSVRAGDVLAALEHACVRPDDFYRGFMRQIYSYTEIPAAGVIPAPSPAFVERASDPDLWFPKSKSRLRDTVEGVLEGPLGGFLEIWDRPYRVYRTACIIEDQLFALGVAGELDREFRALMKERNVLSIDDSNTILKNIIDGSDAPFIYEKIGVRYENFLLDEFQDTSRIQWENFRPLLLDSASRGFDDLIVGDVKQSIYRWRGSDWNLLDSEVEAEFLRAACEVSSETLDTNYRSACNIVDFNNMFFTFMASALDRQYGADARPVAEIYGDVVQRKKRDEKGYVGLTFCPAGSETDMIMSCIGELAANGAAYSDIAVLVRSKSSGAEVAERLVSGNIPVITDDSLKVKSSVTVRRLASLLSWAENPENSINGYLASSMDISVPDMYLSLTDLCESLARSLRERDPELFSLETLYIQSFVDAVSDYVSMYGNDLRGFLEYWEEADPEISSPSAGNAIRIITVHKSKGLDFPFVIFPFVENVTMFRPDNCWCRPENAAGTPLEAASGVYYDVRLSSESDSTLFADDYRRELKLQYVDNFNIMYVAMTRAVKGMRIIAGMPSAGFVRAVDGGGEVAYSDFSQALYHFARMVSLGFPIPGTGNLSPLCGFRAEEGEDGVLSFIYGELPEFPHVVETAPVAEKLAAGYPSFPLNPGDSPDGDGEVTRLRLNADAADFFDDEGHAGIAASNRLRGIVLHRILSGVKVPGDLRAAVEDAVMAGDMDRREAEEAYSLLSDRIASARARGWFPDDPAMVRNEATVIDSDGSLYRPDRIISSDGGLVVVDYKFGEHSPKYIRQISKYADMCRRMGYTKVSAALWYVLEDRVIS